jgi:hypothetical protein
MNKENKTSGKHKNGNDFIADVVKSFYCQKPIDYKPSLKCDRQCGLCATFEGKRQ